MCSSRRVRVFPSLRLPQRQRWKGNEFEVGVLAGWLEHSHEQSVLGGVDFVSIGLAGYTEGAEEPQLLCFG